MNISLALERNQPKEMDVIENKSIKPVDRIIEQLFAKAKSLKDEITELKTQGCKNKESEIYVTYLEKKLTLRKIHYQLKKEGLLPETNESAVTVNAMQSPQELRTLISTLNKVKAKILECEKQFKRDRSQSSKINLLEKQILEWELYYEVKKYSPEEITLGIADYKETHRDVNPKADIQILSQDSERLVSGQKRKSNEKELELSQKSSPKKKKASEAAINTELEKETIVSETHTDTEVINTPVVSASETDSDSGEENVLRKAHEQIKNLKEQIAKQKKQIEDKDNMLIQNAATIANLTRNLNYEIASKAQSSASKTVN